MSIPESAIEQLAVDRLVGLGYTYLDGATLAPGNALSERTTYASALLPERLRQAVRRINPGVDDALIDDALRQLRAIGGGELLADNEAFHRLLTEGIKLSRPVDGQERGEIIWLVDFETPHNNDFAVANQITVIEDGREKRPDIIGYVNGLPLVVLELKKPSDERATVRSAFDQIETYKDAIPGLFVYNAVNVISDGLEAQAGSLSARLGRYAAWRTSDGLHEASHLEPELETLIKGMLNPVTLLDLIRHFTVFEQSRKENAKTGLIKIETVKKVAAYHQYYAVNKAVESTLRATGFAGRRTTVLGLRQLTPKLGPTTGFAETLLREDPVAYGLPTAEDQPSGDRKGGVVWHTQGSGKSLSMVFYTGKIVLALDNPTVLVITDRNDLDDQLFDTFARSNQLLRQDPIQVRDRHELKERLRVASGGVVFTTIQKFRPEEGNVYETLSERENIVVIADEAHRTQYGFAAKLNATTGETTYGFAKYLRDALPNATYLGFTGTPIESEDVNTPMVFGNYVDIYDIAQAQEDGATVKIYYESRLAKVALSEEGRRLVEDLDAELGEDELTDSQKAKAKWTQVEALVGSSQRIGNVARDTVAHFEQRQEVFEGKAMIVAMSRRIAAQLYEAIVDLRPDWHSSELSEGAIKVVMTAASSDGSAVAKHHTTKQQRRTLADRMKDPADPLRLVIVRDMWLTGFDAPSMHTLYIDKPMRGHNLMQAIARVNRVYKDKPGGLVVDYLGIASDLKRALAFYSEAGGKGDPAKLQEDAVAVMLEKLEVVSQMFDGFAYEEYFDATNDTSRKLSLLLEAAEHILTPPRDRTTKEQDKRRRFINEVTALSKAFAIAVPHEEAMDAKDEVGFFQAVKARLVKFDRTGANRTDAELETAIRQVVDQALVSEQVVDIFDAAGIRKPEISILSEEFLLELKGMKQRHVALEVLKKILNDEIRTRARKNVVRGKSLMEMLDAAIKRYQNNVLSAAEVIDELIKLSKEIVEMDSESAAMKLTDFEYAFYSAVADNESARELMGKDKLRELAVELTERVRQNASIDWTIKESVRAKLKVIIKRTLRQFGYPPDMQKLATELVLEQAKRIAAELTRA